LFSVWLLSDDLLFESHERKKGVFRVSKIQTKPLIQFLLGPFNEGPSAGLRLTGHCICCLG